MADVVRDGDVSRYADFDNRGDNREAPARVKRRALERLPVIDLSPFVSGAAVAEREAVARELRRACVDIGFFYLTGHGIPEGELDEAVAWGHRFYALPLEERMKVHKSRSPVGVGYVPAGGSNPGEDRAPDTREVFSMPREEQPGEPRHERSQAGHALWPRALPGLEAFAKRHIDKRIALTRHLLHAFALSLQLPETWFDASHHYLACNLVFNHYAPTDPARIERTQWAISPHTDYGSFTLLSQDGLGGLEVLNAAGDWIQAPPLAGAFVVNIGDLFARWTNDLYVSTLHRAVNYNRGARISVPFFVVPESSVIIECLATCQGPGNPARYEPVKAGDYVAALLDQSRRTGRAGISTQTASRFRPKPGGT